MKKRFLIIICTFALAFLAGRLAISAAIQPNTSEFSFKQEILKFLPFKELNKLLEQNKKLVYMPYKELKALIKKKSAPQKPAPIDYVIKDLKLNGSIEDDYVTFEGDYKIELLNKKWANIPLLSTNAGLKNATLDAAKVPVITSNDYFNVVSDETGDHSLKINFDVKNDKQGNKRAINFKLPDIAIAKVEIKHPLNTADIAIPNSTGLKTIVVGDHKVTTANITGSGNVQIDWKTLHSAQKVVQKPVQKVHTVTKPSKVISNINTLITIDEGLLQGFSDYSFKVYYTPVEKFTFQIPDDIEIINVSSPQNIINEGNYQISDPDKEKPGKLLTVFLNSKLSDSVNLNVSYEKTFENKKATLEIPEVYPVGQEINKVSGYLAVQTSGNSEIKPVKSKNISRVDLSDLPGELENLAEYPIVAAYSFINKGYTLALEVTPHKDAPVQVAMADNAIADSRLSSNGMLTSRVDYTVRNMSEQFFKFMLPEKAEILSVTINGEPKQVEKQEAGEEKFDTYLVNIKKNQNANAFKLMVMYRQKFDTSIMNKLLAHQSIQLPKVLNIPVLTLSWSVYVPDSMKYWKFTDLNAGRKNYFNYISSRVKGYGSTSAGSSVPSQISSNVAIDEDFVEGKVAGILPPEFSMPPTKGLKRFDFSQYLTKPEFIKVSMISIPLFIYYLLIAVLVLLVWRVCSEIHKRMGENPLKPVTLELIGILLVGILLSSVTFWIYLILTVIAYVAAEFVRTKLMQKEA